MYLNMFTQTKRINISKIIYVLCARITSGAGDNNGFIPESSSNAHSSVSGQEIGVKRVLEKRITIKGEYDGK